MDVRDREACYRALQTRDARFDGRLFVGVTSTGIYCRPICPARTPKLENCVFFACAAAAQEGGFRPCLRCRPETAPDFASWRGTSNTVSRALALIERGALDFEGAGADELAERVGVGARQLRRLFQRHLGATPIAVAQTRRVLFAKQLIQETSMSMAEIALAAGFGSVRRYNEVFHSLFGRTPSELRRRNLGNARDRAAAHGGVMLRLRYRPPYDWDAMLAYLAARTIDGVELVAAGQYQRVVALDGYCGRVLVKNSPERESLTTVIHFPSVRALPSIVARVRRVFDLGADIETIDGHLSKDRILAPLVARRPGLRAPGGWDGFEIAVRAVLGQQVTVAAGRLLAGELVRLCSKPIEGGVGELAYSFPSPRRVAAADLDRLGMPRARRNALRELARAACADPRLFEPSGDLESAIARLRAIAGIGEWTAHYIALRALRETDAFPASDAGLLRAMARRGSPTSPAELLRLAEPWRPWRAYAAQHLWTSQVGDEMHARRDAPYSRGGGLGDDTRAVGSPAA